MNNREPISRSEWTRWALALGFVLATTACWHWMAHLGARADRREAVQLVTETLRGAVQSVRESLPAGPTPGRAAYQETAVQRALEVQRRQNERRPGQ